MRRDPRRETRIRSANPAIQLFDKPANLVYFAVFAGLFQHARGGAQMHGAEIAGGADQNMGLARDILMVVLGQMVLNPHRMAVRLGGDK